MRVDFNIYLITDRKLFADCGLMFTVIEDALEAGVKVVQLREKDLTAREFLAMAYQMRELTAKYNARLFINDRADIALCVNADGVHLGQLSMPVYAVRSVVGDNIMIGVSTHNLQEALTAEKDGADFITFGPVYETPSKLKYGKPVGLEALKSVVEKASIPIFAIGGVKADNINGVLNAGASGVAVISGILGESDIKNRVKNYLKVLGE
jgi:thiamine-phosphate pyrophosphorylase